MPHVFLAVLATQAGKGLDWSDMDYCDDANEWSVALLTSTPRRFFRQMVLKQQRCSPEEMFVFTDDLLCTEASLPCKYS